MSDELNIGVGVVIPLNSEVVIPCDDGDIRISVRDILHGYRPPKSYYDYNTEALLDEMRKLEDRIEDLAVFLTYAKSYQAELEERKMYKYNLAMEKAKDILETKAANIKGSRVYKSDIESLALRQENIYKYRRAVRKAEALVDMLDASYWIAKDRLKGILKAIDVKKSLLGDMNAL